MNQFAVVNRLSAPSSGRICEKEIPYQGKNTFFFAYPSGDYWARFLRKTG